MDVRDAARASAHRPGPQPGLVRAPRQCLALGAMMRGFPLYVRNVAAPPLFRLEQVAHPHFLPLAPKGDFLKRILKESLKGSLSKRGGPLSLRIP